MTQYFENRTNRMKQFVESCEQTYGMTSEEFVRYYRELESHGTEEEYDWWVCLSFIGQR